MLQWIALYTHLPKNSELMAHQNIMVLEVLSFQIISTSVVKILKTSTIRNAKKYAYKDKSEAR